MSQTEQVPDLVGQRTLKIECAERAVGGELEKRIEDDIRFAPATSLSRFIFGFSRSTELEIDIRTAPFLHRRFETPSSPASQTELATSGETVARTRDRSTSFPRQKRIRNYLLFLNKTFDVLTSDILEISERHDKKQRDQ